MLPPELELELEPLLFELLPLLPLPDELEPLLEPVELLLVSPELGVAVWLLEELDPLLSLPPPPDPPPQALKDAVATTQKTTIARRINMDRFLCPRIPSSVQTQRHCGILNHQNSPSGFDQRQPGGHGTRCVR
ncbi:hypothetical protein SAHY_11375 [Salinisphaera hydrothermalis EPR70]